MCLICRMYSFIPFIRFADPKRNISKSCSQCFSAAKIITTALMFTRERSIGEDIAVTE